MDELTPRQQLILGLVIREYVSAAQPVGSKTIQGYGLGVSSATIRNEAETTILYGLLKS